MEVEPVQVGLFFTLMQKRHKTKTTLLTSNLGFSDWGSCQFAPPCYNKPSGRANSAVELQSRHFEERQNHVARY